MGWNSWSHFRCAVNETVVERAADAMVATGMKALGYEYVNVDDCWPAMRRDGRGNLQADPARFPHGMRALAAYVHRLGLRFGLYEDAGSTTCAGYPGSFGHEMRDAAQFAAWGVDYLKYDFCHHPRLKSNPIQNAELLYRRMHDALARTGRPIVLSVCDPHRNTQPWTWGARVGSLWRTTQDIQDRWESVLHVLDLQTGLGAFAGPNHWNDPDALQAGNGHMTGTEYRAQVSLWSILAAPLLASNDLTRMSAATRAVLTNREVIAVDQDPVAVEGERIRKKDGYDVWARPLSGGRRAVVVLNRNDVPGVVSITAAELDLSGLVTYTFRDLWAHQTVATGTRASVEADAHEAVMLLVERQPPGHAARSDVESGDRAPRR
jgi:alpha-galactosidase